MIPSRRLVPKKRWGLLLAMTAVSLLALVKFQRTTRAAPPPAPPRSLISKNAAQPAGARVGVDQLLGRAGRAKHAQRLAELQIDGKTHSWKEYSDWGKELFLTAQTKQPPTGPAPSLPLSDFYRCIDCHNNRREDVNLTVQDPEVRAAMIDSAAAPATEGAQPLFLATGTTLWGAVNRESFYNDSYEIYHGLEVGDGRSMDPASLEDATQVCCQYCSVGRFAEPWEIAALLTYFWDLEVTLADLGLPKEIETVVASRLEKPDAGDAKEVAATREFLQRLYLRRAGDTYTAIPSQIGKESVGPYPDKLEFQGDPAIGKRLYAQACDRCHGADKPNEIEGPDLVRDLKRFHTILSKGTEQADQPYMPMFTSQRLSRQQIIDIQTYLLESR